MLGGRFLETGKEKNLSIFWLTRWSITNEFLKQCSTEKENEISRAGIPLFGLYGDVPLDRVWFFWPRCPKQGVQYLTCLCPKHGQNLS